MSEIDDSVYGSGHIHLDEVNCIGNESRLQDCEYDDEDDCYHSEDIGLICDLGKCMFFKF